MSQGAFVTLVFFLGVQGVVANTACSSEDQKFIHSHKGTDSKSFGQMSADCGAKAFGIFSGFSESTFKTCLEKKTGISDSCGSCYAKAGTWGAANCKMACISRWCSSGCLKCASKEETTLERCAGFKEDHVEACTGTDTVPQATVVATGSCSSKDQEFIHSHKGTDSKSFGKMSSDCGHKAYSIFSGFNEKTFESCIAEKAGISHSCGVCYAKAGSYGASNCKMACMSSWCSSGCLKCTAKDEKSLETCAGFQEDHVKPCSGNVEASADSRVFV